MRGTNHRLATISFLLKYAVSTSKRTEEMIMPQIKPKTPYSCDKTKNNTRVIKHVIP